MVVRIVKIVRHLTLIVRVFNVLIFLLILKKKIQIVKILIVIVALGHNKGYVYHFLDIMLKNVLEVVIVAVKNYVKINQLITEE